MKGDNMNKIRIKILRFLLITSVLLTGCASAGSQGSTGAETGTQTETIPENDSKNTGNGNIKWEPNTEVPAVADISGDYYAFSCRGPDGTEYELEDEFLHLESDGTGYFSISGEKYELEWTYDNESFYFVDESGDEFNGSYYNGMIGGTYFQDLYYMLTNDYEFFLNLTGGESNVPVGSVPVSAAPETAGSTAVYYTLQNLYEPKYGIKTAQALVPYGWSASVSVQWGLCSTMYPAIAVVKMVSPGADAIIEITSPFAYMQMARNGAWIPEGTYLDFYNVFLNYRNANQYNNYILGVMGYKGTEIYSDKPSYEFQLDLNGQANTYLAALSYPNGVEGLRCEGTYEKTSYFITEGNAYEVEISSAVIMADILNGANETIQWTVPYTAAFTAFSEEAYGNYHELFDNVTANTYFSNEFIYVVQRNAQYLNDMMREYLMEKVFSPSSGDIRGWDAEYVETDQDRFVNEWCDVIKEQDEYVTGDGNTIKIPTKYDTVYQNGDTIYMGPDTDLGVDWTQLNKS